MPCFSPDGKYLYYAPFSKGVGQIWRMELGSDRMETIFGEAGVNAYYPVTFGEEMFFTKWYSAEDRCDQIMRFDGSQITAMPFDSPDYDCSDPCPLEGGMIFSSTMNGGYDLYFYDGTSVSPLSELNTDKNELGAAFFPYTEEIRGDVNCDGEFNIADLVAMQKWLLAVPGAEVKNWKAGDLWEDERLNVFDLCLMRQELIER